MSRIITRGYGSGLDIPHDVVTRGYGPAPTPPDTGAFGGYGPILRMHRHYDEGDIIAVIAAYIQTQEN